MPRHILKDELALTEMYNERRGVVYMAMYFNCSVKTIEHNLKLLNLVYLDVIPYDEIVTFFLHRKSPEWMADYFGKTVDDVKQALRDYKCIGQGRIKTYAREWYDINFYLEKYMAILELRCQGARIRDFLKTFREGTVKEYDIDWRHGMPDKGIINNVARSSGWLKFIEMKSTTKIIHHYKLPLYAKLEKVCPYIGGCKYCSFGIPGCEYLQLTGQLSEPDFVKFRVTANIRLVEIVEERMEVLRSGDSPMDRLGFMVTRASS
jgi:hypothetical protein